MNFEFDKEALNVSKKEKEDMWSSSSENDFRSSRL